MMNNYYLLQNKQQLLSFRAIFCFGKRMRREAVIMLNYSWKLEFKKVMFKR